MKSRLLSLLAASLVAVVLAAGSAQASDPDPAAEAAAGGGTAQALAANPYPTWVVAHTQYLAAVTIDEMPTTCQSQRLHLGAALYNWGHIFDGGWGLRWSQLRLGEADYIMTTCLDPINWAYVHTTTLDPIHPTWSTIQIQETQVVWNSGNVYWGAFLDPLL